VYPAIRGRPSDGPQPAVRSDSIGTEAVMLDFEALTPESGLVEPPLMTETDHFLDENDLLLVVETGE
jgi:hypothetical protein